MREWADIAVLAKAKNLQGGFVVRATAGLPFLLEEGMEVVFVPPVLDAPRRAIVESLEQHGPDAIVFFDEVTDRSTAERLSGCHCLVRRALLPEEALLGHAGIVGWTAIDDAAGFEGTVADVIENPGQSLLELSDESGRSVLVPLVDDFIESVDDQSRTIRLNAPAGLFDLQ